MRRRRAEAGFTLLELLIALAIFGLLTTSLVAAVRGTLGFFQRAADRHQSIIDPAIARDTLRREIGALLPLRIADGRGRAGLSLQGTSVMMLMRVDLPAAFGGTSRWLQLRHEADADGQRLVIRHLEAEAGLEPDPLGAIETSRLIEGVAALRLAYLPRPQPWREPAWRERWTDESELPALIRIELWPVDPQAPRPPPLLIRPMVDATAP